MRIVRIKSGLGNQMFQYAFYRKLLSNNNNVKLDISTINKNKDHNGYELNKIFNVVEFVATDEEIIKYSDDKNDLLSRLRKKIFGIKKTHYIPKKFSFEKEYLQIDNVLLDGYWQSEKYFKDISSIIRNDFIFKNKLDEKNKNMIDKITNTNSVSIHIRRGDYLSPQYIKKFGQSCPISYYKKAIDYIKKTNNKCKFFVFSDDIEWTRKTLLGDEFTFIDWNTKQKSYIDMQLMSNCKHNIIANSSFSWWAAWLNNNSQKIVVAPKIWFRDNQDYRDVLPEDWIKF